MIEFARNKVSRRDKPQNTVFNKSMEEETKTIDNIAQGLLRKDKYHKIFKSNDLKFASTSCFEENDG